MTALSTLLASATLTLHAQSWVTLLDPAHGGIAGLSSDICTDAIGNLYAVGNNGRTTDGTMRAVVLGSGDHGATWSPLDAYAEPGLNYAHNRAVAWNPLTGSILTGGNLNNLLPNGTYQYDTLWFIRESDPVTGLWATVDDYSVLASDVGQASCADILVTPSGVVYATGGSALGTGPGFMVRKRPAGAAAFTTVVGDYSRQTAGSGWDLCFHPGYGVFAVGDVNGIWTVRNENVNTGSWVGVDRFKTTEWTQTSARSIVATASGALHVAGWGYSSKARKYYWMVRSSYNGGATWSISDTYSLGGSTVDGFTITEDKVGNLFVCGQAADTAGKLWWLVRKGVPGTTRVRQGGKWITVPTVTWTNSDLYQLVAGQPAQANGITVDDATGTIFASGRAIDASGVNQWIVRKLAAQ